MVAYLHFEGASSLNDCFAIEHSGQGHSELVGQQIWEIAHPTEIDAENWDVFRPGQSDHPQERTVTSHADGDGAAGQIDGIHINFDLVFGHPIRRTEVEHSGLVANGGQPIGRV
jgi:hypothetical protein